MNQLPRPVARCTKCGVATTDVGAINAPCYQTADKKRCKGLLATAIKPTDWTKCAECGGGGCEKCMRRGWRYTGDSWPPD